MSDGADIRNILVIIAGVMLATTLFVVVLVFFARLFDWSISFTERFSSLFISCEHCGAPLSLEGKNCKSCGKPISQTFLKKHRMRMLAVCSFELTFFVLIMGNILFASIPFVLGLVFGGYERYYTKIIRDFKTPKEGITSGSRRA
jgi:hypothetical protein